MGKRENQFVLANIFDPQSPLDTTEKVQELAEKACIQAKDAFGNDDPIHLKALLNLSIFYYVNNRPSEAKAHLALPIEILASNWRDHEILLVELLAMVVLVEISFSHEQPASFIQNLLTSTIIAPFDTKPPANTQALDVYKRMSKLSQKADQKVLRFLVGQIGSPLALELASDGHCDLAVPFLEKVVIPLQEKVWGKNHDVVRQLKEDATWLSRDKDFDYQLYHDLQRLVIDLTSIRKAGLYDGFSDLGDKPTSKLLREAFDLVNQLIQDEDNDNPVQPIKDAIKKFHAVLKKIDSYNGSNNDNIRLLVCVSCSLGALYSAVQSLLEDGNERAIMNLRNSLKLLYKHRRNLNLKDELIVDRHRVWLADLYSRRNSGDLEENTNKVLVYSDSLDFEEEEDKYYWAMGKQLRAFGYVNRQSTKLNAGAKPEPEMESVDQGISFSFLQESLKVFTREEYPFEWASGLFFWSLSSANDQNLNDH